jgi:type IV secretion system protein VirD4
MKNPLVLDNLNSMFSRLASLRGEASALHHGRFARPHELKSIVSHSLDEEALLIGRTHFGGIYRVRKTANRRELGNMMVVAPPRSGKSQLGKNQLLTWPHSVVAVDLKGELYQDSGGFRSTLGPVYVIDLRGNGHQYDPLRNCTNEESLYDAAKNILYDPNEGNGRSFTEWGILLEVLKWQACLELNRKTGAKHRLLPFTRFLAKLGINPAAAAINAISPAIAQELLDGEYDPSLDYRENRYFANSWQSSRARMYPLLTEKVVRCFNGSDFTGKDIIAGDKPVSVYLRIPQGMLKAKAPVIRLVLESLTTEMFETFDEPHGAVCRPVLMLLDEAGTVGFQKLPEYAATAAGRGISLWLALQDIGQLERYGSYEARTIRNSMAAKVFFHQNDPATAKHIEELSGYMSGYSRSETLRDGEVASEGRSETAVALFPMRDSLELEKEDIIFFVDNLKPGRGKSMAPWHFPLLEKRRAIPPPPVKEPPPVPEIALPDDASPLEEEAIHLDTPDTLFPSEREPAPSRNPPTMIFKGKRK